jgi:serine/threonine protein kinase
MNEIQTLKNIEDQSIVKTQKLYKSSNNIYLVYEFLNGGSIQKILEER